MPKTSIIWRFALRIQSRYCDCLLHFFIEDDLKAPVFLLHPLLIPAADRLRQSYNHRVLSKIVVRVLNSQESIPRYKKVSVF